MSGEAAASRSSGAGGTRVTTSRRGRLDERAWRDVDRMIKLGKKSDAYSVEIHGARIIFKKGAPNPSQDTKEKKGVDAPASRQRVESTSGPASRLPKAPNSAQRRSAERMKEFMQKKQGSGAFGAMTQPSLAELQSEEPVRVETDVRADAEMAETTGDDRRGQKRAASESPACAPPPSAQPAAARHTQQRVDVKPTLNGGRGREHRGLEPLQPDGKPTGTRRARAPAATQGRARLS